MVANTMGDQLVARLRSANVNLLNLDDREKSDILTRAELEFTVRRFIPDLNVKQKGFEIDTKRRLDLSGLITSHVTFRRLGLGINVGDFILGSEDNGALRTPDTDYQNISYNSSHANSEDETDFGMFCRIPDECLFIISETCETSKGTTVKQGVPVIPITYDYYLANIRDPYNSPYYNRVWRLDSGNYTPSSSGSSEASVRGLTGRNADNISTNLSITTNTAVLLIPGKGWIINKYNIHYVKKPRNIVVDTITPSAQISSELNPLVHDEIVDIAVRLYMSDKMPEQSKYQVAEKENREDE